MCSVSSLVIGDFFEIQFCYVQSFELKILFLQPLECHHAYTVQSCLLLLFPPQRPWIGVWEGKGRGIGEKCNPVIGHILCPPRVYQLITDSQKIPLSLHPLENSMILRILVQGNQGGSANISFCFKKDPSCVLWMDICVGVAFYSLEVDWYGQLFCCLCFFSVSTLECSSLASSTSLWMIGLQVYTTMLAI